MSARILAAFVFVLAACSSRAADPPPELKYVPANAAAFVYVDVATLYDGLLAEVFKEMRPEDAKPLLAGLAEGTGLAPADVKSMLFAIPTLKEPGGWMKTVQVVTCRAKYDRKKVVAELKKKAEDAKAEYTEKGDLVRVETPAFFGPDKTMETVTDLSDPYRVVTVAGLGDEALKGFDGKGVHADFLTKNAGAVFLAGMNPSALPDEAFREELPPQLAPFKPLLLADRIGLVGTMTKDKFTLTAEVVSKDKQAAADVEKAAEAGRKVLSDGLAEYRKTWEEDGKELKELFDTVQAAFKAARVSTDDKTTTAVASMARELKMAPLVKAMQEAGARMTALNNLKQIGLAMHNHESAYSTLPPAVSVDQNGKRLHSWRVHILPFIEEEALYKKFKLDEPWDSEHNLKVVKDNPMPRAYAMPGTTNATDKKTHFQVFVGPDTVFQEGKGISIPTIADGTSNTIMVAASATAVDWTKPEDIAFDPKGNVKPKLLDKFGGYLVGMGDGSTRVVRAKVDEKVLKAAITKSGGEVSNLPD